MNDFEKSYERIKNKLDYDENIVLYDEKYIKKLISYFIQKEEYEKCDFLKKYIEKRFNCKKRYIYFNI